MSKMREAFEKHATTFTPPLVLARSVDDYIDGETAIAWHDFKAGYQAAIAAVKEGGAAAWVMTADQYRRPPEIYLTEPMFVPPICTVTPLYKLPED